MEYSGISLVFILFLSVVSSSPTPQSSSDTDSASLNSDDQISLCKHLDMSRCIFAKDNRATFHLFTKSNPKGYELKADDVTNLRSSNFLVGKKVKVLVHGFVQGKDDQFPKGTKDAYIKGGEDLNVISVDWSQGASFIHGYGRAAECTREVGLKIAALLKSLIKEKLTSPDKIHIVGHSLGAHISGLAGREFSGTLGRVTGLDPANPCFELGSSGYAYRINKTDAVFVDVIHTDGHTKGNDALGMSDMIGHVDFFPNGGKRDQPGCIPTGLKLDPCSHVRAPQFFTESVENPKAFIGRECENYEKFLKGGCNGRSTRVMGDATPTNPANGNGFYLKTSILRPFGKGVAGSTS